MDKPGKRASVAVLQGIGEFPRDWKLIPFGSAVVHTQLGLDQQATTASTGLPMIKMGNMTRGGFDLSKIERIEESEPGAFKEYFLKKGDFLFNTRNSADLVGKTAIWDGEDNTHLFNSNIMRIYFDKTIADPRFICYFMSSEAGWKLLRRIVNRTTSVAAIYWKDLATLPVPVPTTSEQKGIASILETAEHQIKLALKSIEYTTQLKRDLVQHLLTRGIGHATFKKTLVGEMPDSWSLAKLADRQVSSKTRAGGTPRRSVKAFFECGSIPFVKIEDMTRTNKYLLQTEERISSIGLENSSAWIVPAGSILFSMYASYGEVVINRVPVATSQAILGIIPSELINPEFLYYYLTSIKPKLSKYLRQTTQKNLNAQVARTLWIPLPSLQEQSAIASVLAQVDSVLYVEINVMNKLVTLRRGLLQALLTGKVRIET